MTMNETQIDQFLFDEMTDAEREQFEKDFIADDDLFYELADRENALVDAYAKGQLRGAELSRFEKTIATMAARRQKIANAKKHIFYDHSIGVNHLYMPSRNRSLAIMRSRQRGIGLIYSKYKLSPLVIIRGMCSPLLKMIISFNFDSIKLYYNILVGRLEGFFYRQKQV